MWNSTKTHLSCPIVTSKNKKCVYNISATVDRCESCTKNTLGAENQYVITQGTDLPQSEESSTLGRWLKCCLLHVSHVKKQHCNSCNQTAKVNKIPNLCIDCFTLILESTKEMEKVCRMPILGLGACGCKYCSMR